MGKASAVYLRATGDEINEWMVATLDQLPLGDEKDQLVSLILTASMALQRAARLVEHAPGTTVDTTTSHDATRFPPPTERTG